jgi:hypothetical protein
MTFGYKLIHGRWGSLALTASLQLTSIVRNRGTRIFVGCG